MYKNDPALMLKTVYNMHQENDKKLSFYPCEFQSMKAGKNSKYTSEFRKTVVLF